MKGKVIVVPRTVRGKTVRVYVYDPWWRRIDRQDPVAGLIDTLPPADRRFYRLERLAVASRTTPDPKDVAIIYRRRVKVVVRLRAKNKRGYVRVPALTEERMAGEEKRTVVLHDGTTTDNTGWKKVERVGATPNFTKKVNGKLYVLDHWAAMGARIDGSFGVDVAAKPTKVTYEFIPPKREETPLDAMTKSLKRYQRERAEEMRRAATRDIAWKPTPVSKKPKTAPKRKGLPSTADILSRKAKQLTRKRKGD